MADIQLLIKQRLLETVGANFTVEIVTGARDGYQIRFSDLEISRGPLLLVRPEGIKRYRIELSYGKFSRETLLHLQNASQDSKAVAMAFLSHLIKDFELDAALIDLIVNPNQTNTLTGFSIKLSKNNSLPESYKFICDKVLAPILLSFAELLGYEDVDENDENFSDSAMEGAVSLVIVKKRERSKKNRALALLIHGHKCLACDLDPSKIYDNKNSIIEVHHLQPLSQNKEPRPYDPALDLVPKLSPNYSLSRPDPFDS